MKGKAATNENDPTARRDRSDRILHFLETVGRVGLLLASIAGILIWSYFTLYFLNFVGRRGSLGQFILLVLFWSYLGFSLYAAIRAKTTTFLLTVGILLSAALITEEIWATLLDTTTIRFGWEIALVFAVLWTLRFIGRLRASRPEGA